MKFAALIFPLFAFTTLSTPVWQNQPVTNIISTARLTDWTVGTHVGVLGGPLTNRTSYTNLTLSGDMTTILSNALVNCPSNQAVVLSAGSGYITGHQYLSSFTTLRGAGMGSSSINCSNGAGFKAAADNSTYLIYLDPYSVAASAGTGKGSSNVTMVSTTNFVIGKGIMIARFSSTNQSESPIVLGVGGTNQQNGYLFKQVSRVTATNATSVTFWPPLVPDMSGYPVRCLPLTLMKQGIGIEDLRVNISTNTQMGFDYGANSDCWFVRVRMAKPNNYSISLIDGVGAEITGCYIEGNGDSSPNHAGVLWNSQCASLCEDNVIVNSFPCMEINSGSAGNVVSYNFMLNNNGLFELDANHGAHNSFNLYEGNVFGRFLSDGFFGSDSDGTVYRNWGHGIAPGSLDLNYIGGLKRLTRNYSLVGNIWYVGGSYTNVYHYDGWSYGQPNLGNSNDNGRTAPTWPDWARVGTLTTRTDDDTGVITFSSTPAYPAYVVAQGQITLSWGASTYQTSASVTATNGDTATFDGGSGTVLPATSTTIYVWGGPAGYQERDTGVTNTLVNKLNYNFESNAIPTAQESIYALTDSLYLSAKPSFFPASYTYPPINSASVPSLTGLTNTILIPAQYAYINDGVWPSNPAMTNRLKLEGGLRATGNISF